MVSFKKSSLRIVIILLCFIPMILSCANNTNSEEEKNRENFAFKIQKVSQKEIVLENKGDKYYLGNKEAGFIDRQAMLSLEDLGEEFGYDCIIDDGVYILKKEGYAFSLSGKSNQVQRQYDGSVFDAAELMYNPVYRNNMLYLADVDLSSLLGVNKQWDSNTKEIHFQYPEYAVNDYGKYEILGEKLVIKAFGDSDVRININNKTLDQRSNQYGAYNDANARFEIESIVNLGYKQNELDIAVTFQGRILLFKTIKNVYPNIKSHKLEKEKNIGPFTNVKIINPTEGYVETKTEKYQVKGEIASVNEDTLTVEVEKLDEAGKTFKKLAPQALPIIKDSFCGDLILTDGYGIYRIKAYVNINGLHGWKTNGLVFDFYINYLQ